MQKIEHIGIAVNDLERAKKLYSEILGVGPYKDEIVESEGVQTSFFRVGPNKIELLQATNSESAIFRYLEKHKEGVHHIAFAVDDIVHSMEEYKKKEFVLLNEKPLRGADNKWICFLHPKSCNGVLIELCQEREEGDIFE